MSEWSFADVRRTETQRFLALVDEFRNTFPLELVQRCLECGCKPHGLVLDPFAGSGTTLVGALMSARPAVGIELNDNYCALAEKRIKDAFSSRKHVVDGDYTRTSSKGKINPRKKTSSTHGSWRSRDDLRAHK